MDDSARIVAELDLARLDLAHLPGWAGEGRAVWTGAAYGGSPDTTFVPNHGTGGAMYDATMRGYHGGEKLKELVSGENERYRDNYTAGYALWLYLSTWEEGGRRLFEPRLDGEAFGELMHRVIRDSDLAARRNTESRWSWAI